MLDKILLLVKAPRCAKVGTVDSLAAGKSRWMGKSLLFGKTFLLDENLLLAEGHGLKKLHNSIMDRSPMLCRILILTNAPIWKWALGRAEALCWAYTPSWPKPILDWSNTMDRNLLQTPMIWKNIILAEALGWAKVYDGMRPQVEQKVNRIQLVKAHFWAEGPL